MITDKGESKHMLKVKVGSNRASKNGLRPSVTGSSSVATVSYASKRDSAFFLSVAGGNGFGKPEGDSSENGVKWEGRRNRINTKIKE